MKDLKPGSLLDIDGVQHFLIGYCRDPGYAMAETMDGKSRVLTMSNRLKPWNEPLSFSEEREAIAREIEPRAYVDEGATIMLPARIHRMWAARIRALEPDAPAAAVAGSAEPVGYIRADALSYLQSAIPEEERVTTIDSHQDSIRAIPLYLAPPSPPLPNPVAFDEAPPVGKRWRHKKSGGIYTHVAHAKIESTLVNVVVYRAEEGSVWVRPFAEFHDGRFEEVDAETPSAPEFDEAAERKLFEAWWHEFDPAALLGELQNCARSAWLASAKVQRGTPSPQPSPVCLEAGEAVARASTFTINRISYHSYLKLTDAKIPDGAYFYLTPPPHAPFDEVVRELLEKASYLHNSPRLPNRFQLADELRSLAAKLGGSK